MAKPGRKPKPAAQHLAAGTFRSDRHGPRPPIVPETVQLTVPLEIPPAPETLSELGAEKWQEAVTQILAIGYWQARFSHALECYCLAWQELHDIHAFERQMDEAARGGKGDPNWRYPVNAVSCLPSAHPILTRKSRALDSLRKWASELGLTPSAGQAIGAVQQGKGKGGISQRDRSRSARPV